MLFMATQIQISQLNVSAGGRRLLQNASVAFRPGELTLLLGCSGVGKSVLLRILAGLIESGPASPIQYTGDIQFCIRSGDSADFKAVEERPLIAVVFQNFALLDELTPLQNVRIAMDHVLSSPGSDRSALATSLLNDLSVPTDRSTGVLSGGQRQRLAIARAVGMQTDVILYDEPTSGLDVNTGAQVANLIRETHDRYGRTSIIVTHDYESLSQIADRIVLLDHHHQCLVELPREDWGKVSEILGKPPLLGGEKSLEMTGPGTAILNRLTRSLEMTGEAVGEVLLLPWSLLPIWRSVVWGARSTVHYLRLVAGPSACVYIAAAGMIIGYVAQDFIFRYLPFRKITEPLLTENLLNATGFSLYRFLVPILSTILIAARSGAAVAADVGSKVYGSQIDAMKTIGMNPERTLRTPILYAFLVGTPFLTFFSYAVASVTAAFAFSSTHGDLGIAFWDLHFHQALRTPDGIWYKGSGWLFAKLLTCGIGIGMISWRCGISPKESGPEISHGVTRTILWSTLYVLLVHFVYSLFEFKATI